MRGSSFCQNIIDILSEDILPDLDTNIVDNFFVTQIILNMISTHSMEVGLVYSQSLDNQHILDIQINHQSLITSLVGAGSHPGAGVPGVLSCKSY